MRTKEGGRPGAQLLHAQIAQHLTERIGSSLPTHRHVTPATTGWRQTAWYVPLGRHNITSLKVVPLRRTNSICAWLEGDCHDEVLRDQPHYLHGLTVMAAGVVVVVYGAPGRGLRRRYGRQNQIWRLSTRPATAPIDHGKLLAGYFLISPMMLPRLLKPATNCWRHL